MQAAVENRPVPLEKRWDLVQQDVEFQGEEYRVVKDPLALTYFHLRAEQYLVLDALDGSVSIEELRSMLQKVFPAKHVTKTEVQSLLLDLHRKALVQTQRPGQSEVLHERAAESNWARFRSTCLNPMFIKLPGLNPASVLRLADWVFGWLFTKSGVLLVAICFIVSLACLSFQYDNLLRRLPAFQQFFGWPNILFLWLTIGFTKVAHEFGHALACKRFGCRCHSIGIAFLVFSPTMYCDASDSWMLRNKWERICIAAAGMYVEVLLSSIAVLLWLLLQPGLLQNLCLNVFFVSAFSTVIFNANPLIKFDGYYILSDLLEIPNLREKSRTVIQRALVWCCGLQSPPNPFLPDSGRFLFGSYAIAAFVYGWMILFWIALGLYKMLEPYHLESVGVTLALASVGVSLIGGITNFGKAIQAAEGHNRNMHRLVVTVTVLCCLVLCGLVIPIPQIVEGPFVAEPRAHQIVSIPVAGSIDRVGVKAGTQVTKGEILIQLVNSDIEDRIDSLQMELELKEADAHVFDLLDRNEEYAVVKKTITGLRREIAELEKMMESLAVTAPCSGKIVEVGSRKSRPSEEHLERWLGSPLDGCNVGAFLERATEICVVAPQEEFDAILYLGQHDREDLEIGQELALKCDAVPAETLRGIVVAIAENSVEFLPPTLSNKFGGTEATTTDLLGREKPELAVYQVRIELDEFPAQVAQLRGRARIIVTHRTLWEYMVRLARRTFLFQI